LCLWRRIAGRVWFVGLAENMEMHRHA